MNKPFRRRGQGVITGLAAKKAALLKGVSPLNRPTLNRANLNKHGTNRAPAKRSTLYQVPRSTQRQTWLEMRMPDTHTHTHKNKMIFTSTFLSHIIKINDLYLLGCSTTTNLLEKTALI